jgi:hypothetical protein
MAIAAMQDMGKPTSTAYKGHFSQFSLQERLALSQIIDFLPGVESYDSRIEVDIIATSDGYVRTIVTLHQMHDVQTTKMQHGGFVSQLSKLDKLYGWHS